MPKPVAGESKDKYLPRCMSNPETLAKYPDQAQRYAVCNSMWERHDKSFEKSFEITKIDQDEKKVFGIFSMVSKNGEPLVDLDGDVIDAHELEKAAYAFNLYARNAGENHVKKTGIGRLIESFVFTKEKVASLRDALEKAGVANVSLDMNAEFWYGGFQIDDEDVWALVKSGEYSSFSIGGFADRVSE